MFRKRTSVMLAVVAACALATPLAAVPAAAAPAKIKVSVKASKTSIIRGTQAKLTVTVKKGSGKVIVYDGKKKVKTLTLKKGKATFKTPKTARVGVHKYKFVHKKSKRSAAVKVTVRTKAALTAKVSAATFKREGTPPTVNAHVTADGKSAAGVFTLTEGSTVTAMAKAVGGSAALRLPAKLTKGAHTFRVTFAPSSKYVVAPPAATVKVNVTSDAAFAGDGTFIVGVDVMPGLYVSRGNDYCYWSRDADFAEDIIANDGGGGDRYVRVKASDKVLRTSSCEDFLPAVSGGTPATAITRPGHFRIGVDLAPGLYRTDAPREYCYWARLADASAEFRDIIANDGGAGHRIVQVLPSDAFLEVSNECGTWSRIG